MLHLPSYAFSNTVNVQHLSFQQLVSDHLHRFKKRGQHASDKSARLFFPHSAVFDSLRALRLRVCQSLQVTLSLHVLREGVVCGS